MKNMKKLVMAVTALTMCATSAFAFSACKDDEDNHEHTYTWTTTTPPTCETDGLETGICEADGDTQTRPVDKLGHSYGDWQITKPTATKDGSAKKVCKNDASHPINVTLPKFGTDNKGYKVEAVSGSEVAKKYTYTDATHGDISFTAVNLNSVETAVKAGTEFNKNVVSGTVDFNTTTSRSINSTSLTGGPIEVLVDGENGEKEVWLVPNGTKPENYTTDGKNVGVVDDKLTEVFKGTESEPFFQIGSNSELLYEFGDKYLHVKNDAERTEGFYNFDENGKLIFPVSTMYVTRDGVDNKLVIKDEDATDELADGFAFCFTYYNVEDGAKFYGVGAFVTKLYECAKLNPNSDFAEAITEKDGKTYYTFSFGEYLEATGFNKVSVKFTLNDDYVIDWAELECKSYRTTDWNTANNERTPNVTVNKDGDIYSVAEGHEDHWKEYECFTLTQKTSYGDAAAPVNPYKLEDMIITSYDWEVSGATVDKDDATKFTADPTNPVTLQFKNIAPATFNSYFDSIKIYERVYSEQGTKTDANGKKYDDVELTNDYDGVDDGHIKAYFNSEDNNVTLTSYIAGTHTLVLKTEKTEKFITLDVPYAAPTSFMPDIYKYDEVKDKGLWAHTAIDADAKVYAGQKLYFNSYVAHPAYQNAEFTANADAGATLGTEMIEGKNVSTFVAETEGTYTVTLTSKVGAKVATIEVNVVTPPSVSAILNGEYKNADNEEETVAFAPASENALSGEATLNVSLGKTKLENVKFNYAYDTTNKEFTITNVPDAQSGLELGLELSPSYKLFLTYKDEFANIKKIYLVNEMPNALVGDHTIAADRDSAEELTANYLGEYTVKLPSSTMAFYSVNGETTQNNALDDSMMNFADEFVVRLGVGDTIKIWSGTLKDLNYSISCTPLTAISSISLDKYEASAVVGNDPVTIIATPSEDGDAKDVVWSSSNKNVAIVSEYGVVTPVGEGEATITCQSKYNPDAKAECKVTVTVSHVTGVSLDTTSATCYVGGDKLLLNATFTPADASNKELIWTSSDETVATVIYGEVTFLKAGNVTITCKSAEDESITATCAIEVRTNAVDSVSLPATFTHHVGSTVILEPEFTGVVADQEVSDKTVTWTSSDETVATVDEEGVIKGLKEGTTTITVTTADGNKTATCTLTVAAAPTLSLENANTLSLVKNQTVTYEINGAANAYYDVTVEISGGSGMMGRGYGLSVNEEYIFEATSIISVSTDGEGKATVEFVTHPNYDDTLSVTASVAVGVEKGDIELGEKYIMPYEHVPEKTATFIGDKDKTYTVTLDSECGWNLGEYSITGAEVISGDEGTNASVTFDVKPDANGKITITVVETSSILVTEASATPTRNITLGETVTSSDDLEPGTFEEFVFIGTPDQEYNVNIDAYGYGIGDYKVAGKGDPIEVTGTEDTMVNVKVTADSEGKIVISIPGMTSITVTEA